MIVPPCCLVCRAPLGAHHLLCPALLEGRAASSGRRCATCWAFRCPSTPASARVSAAALAHPPAYDRARAVAHFSGSMRTLVHQLKYADRHDARTLFGRWLAEAGRELQPGIDIIVPVPLSRLRLLLRHFNQAAVLARRAVAADRRADGPHAAAADPLDHAARSA